MSELLVRLYQSGSLRQIEVHALRNDATTGDQGHIPLLKVVDLSYVGKFSKPSTLSPNAYDGDPSIEAQIVDTVNTASKAAAAIVAFFGDNPEQLAYYAPNEHLVHMPAEFVRGLPEPLGDNIQKLLAESVLPPLRGEYNPRGPYL